MTDRLLTSSAFQLVQAAKLIGLYKYSPNGYSGIGLINGIKWDFTFLCFLLLHRHMLQRKGHWNSEERKRTPRETETSYV